MTPSFEALTSGAIHDGTAEAGQFTPEILREGNS
jgi:hypothetical protein